MHQLAKILKYLITDEQNQYDAGILVWLTGCVTYLYRGWTVTPFDFQSFGIGLAGVLGAGAVLKWTRDHGNPGLPLDANGPTAGVTTTNSAGTQQ